MNKFLKGLCTSLTLFLLLALSAAAAAAEKPMQAAVQNVSAPLGGTARVPIVISENPGIISLQLAVEFDDEKLKLVSVEDGGILGAEIQHADKLQSPYTLSWANYLYEGAFSENGVVCTLVFEVVGGEAGEETEISLSSPKYGVMNMALEDLPLTLQNGTVRLTDGTLPANYVLWISLGLLAAAAAATGVFLIFHKKFGGFHKKV